MQAKTLVVSAANRCCEERNEKDRDVDSISSDDLSEPRVEQQVLRVMHTSLESTLRKSSSAESEPGLRLVC